MKPKRYLSVELDGKRADFEVLGEWEGMSKLRGADGTVLIVMPEKPRSHIGTWLDAILGGTEGEKAVVMLATPGYFATPPAGA
jgi:hypothetical protein